MEPVIFLIVAVFVIGLIYSVFSSASPGRKIADAIGLLCCIAGVFLVLGGLLGAILPIPGLGAAFFIPGAILLVVGIAISHTASRKTCPQCAEQVKIEASKCRYCGHEFAAIATRPAASEPFYK